MFYIMRQSPRLFFISLVIIWLAFWLRFDQLASLPFGWHLDEAAHGVEARDVLAGHWPIFFSQFTGHEALFTYLLAGAFALFGDSIFSARWVTACAGLLTVALTIPLGAALWPGRRGRLTGQLAALFLSVALWHLIASRNNYRAILEPLLQIPTLIFFLCALRHASVPNRLVWLEWALAGLFLGLNIHTYLAARAFPVVVAGAGVAALVAGPRRVERVKGLMLLAGVAGLIVLPLAIYFYQNPGDVSLRTAQVTIWSDPHPGEVLWRNLQDTARMVMTSGDPSFKFNIRGRPVFDPVLGSLFWAGLVLAIGRLFTRQWFPALLLLIWLGVMLLPMVLSTQGIPHYVRAIGVLPGWMFFPALILVDLWEWLTRRLGAPPRRTWAEWGLLAPVVALSLAAHPVLFNQWGGVLDNDAERVVQAAYLAAELKPLPVSDAVYISSSYPEQVTLAYLIPAWHRVMHGFDNRQSVPLPPPGQPRDYYILLEDPPNPDLLERAGLDWVRTTLGRFGQPVYAVYHWAGQWPTPGFTSPMGWGWETAFPAGWQPNPLVAPVNFQDKAQLVGYDLTATSPHPGDSFKVILYWQLTNPTAGPYSMFAHVLNEQSQVVTQFDENRYPSFKWRPGELLLSEFPLTLPTDTPAGTYQLEVGLYHQLTGERLVVMVNGEELANRVLLKTLTVP